MFLVLSTYIHQESVMSPPWLVPVLSLHSDPQTQPPVTLNDLAPEWAWVVLTTPSAALLGLERCCQMLPWL